MDVDIPPQQEELEITSNQTPQEHEQSQAVTSPSKSNITMRGSAESLQSQLRRTSLMLPPDPRPPKSTSNHATNDDPPVQHEVDKQIPVSTEVYKYTEADLKKSPSKDNEDDFSSDDEKSQDHSQDEIPQRTEQAPVQKQPNDYDKKENSDGESEEEIDPDLKDMITYFQNHSNPLEAFENFFDPGQVEEYYETKQHHPTRGYSKTYKRQKSSSGTKYQGNSYQQYGKPSYDRKRSYPGPDEFL